MPTSDNNPDLQYLKSRTDILNYEDSAFTSLISAVCDYYQTRNDQSIWGNMLRAVAQELAKLNYDYTYDTINKNPALLTPPDIRRRWAAPLYVSGSWPSPTQFDTTFKAMLVGLIAAYQLGATLKSIEEVIFAYTGINLQVIELYTLIGNGVYTVADSNTLKVSVDVGGSQPLSSIVSISQLQQIIASLYGAVDLAKPAHVGLEFNAVFSEGDTLDCYLSPTILTQEQIGQAPQSEQIYYDQTGYCLVNPVLFWKSSSIFVPNSVLRDENGNLQMTILGGTSGNIVPSWNTVSEGSTTDGTIGWLNISPSATSIAITSNVVTVVVNNNFSLGQVVTPLNLGNATFLNGVKLVVASVSATQFTAAFTHANYTITAETQGTISALPQGVISSAAWAALPTIQQNLYQPQWTNSNCASPGLEDALSISIDLVENPPLNPTLYAAPILDPINPTTTVGAWGRQMAQTLTPSQWQNLNTVSFGITNTVSNGQTATYTYLGCSATHVEIVSNVLTITGVNNLAVGQVALLSGFVGAAFLNGQCIVVSTASSGAISAQFVATNYSTASDVGTAQPFLHDGMQVTITGCRSEFNVTAIISDVEGSTFQVGNISTVSAASETGEGYVSPSLQAGYYLYNGNYVLGQLQWATATPVFEGQFVADTAGNTQIAIVGGTTGGTVPTWNEELQGSTTDGSVIWRCLGVNPYWPSYNWTQVLNLTVSPVTTPTSPTGEVSNWNAKYPAGLLAPRMNAAWEISSDYFLGFEMT
jgi:hypothetical protein